MRLLMTAAVVAVAIAGSSCGAVSRGGRLAHRGQGGQLVYLTTGGAPREFRTLGFVQVRGYGVEVAGLVDVGDAALDHTVRIVLAEEAQKMGGDGVIHIDFLDENPSTDLERAQAVANTAHSLATRQGQVQHKDRYVTATGEVIKFVQ